MIEELLWDSEFFGKTIGRLSAVPQSLKTLNNAVERARRAGYRYLHCKLEGGRPEDVRLLESAGFYLTDIGVIWETPSNRPGKKGPSVKEATEEDITHIRALCRGLFKESRFYRDPFFKKDADRFFAAWVENSVMGKAADRVFFIKGAGFATARKVSHTVGEMPLIGVAKGKQGKGYGMALISAVMWWFKQMKVKTVRTRTQLRNIQAMNFYHCAGFNIAGFDIVMGKELK